MKRMYLCAALLVVALCNDMLAGPAASRLVRRATHAISARDIVVAGSAMAAMYTYLRPRIEATGREMASLTEELTRLHSEMEEQKTASEEKFTRLLNSKYAMKLAQDTNNANLVQLNQDTQEKCKSWVARLFQYL